ncbi:MAG: 30S ribosomal protein S8 [candidate division Zixibacteria bacterium]|nr:30S ribosomal protein S8 [candidate division Zixibacteria bacterium]
MGMTDPVADLLTRIRNGSHAQKPAIDVPSSKLKVEIVKILKEHHFVSDSIDLPNNKQGILRVYLRYAAGDVPVIKGMRRISRPGLRKYIGADEVRLSTHNTRGISVLSTSSGVMSNFDAARKKIGGEILLKCW